jgi:hypothetical protein
MPLTSFTPHLKTAIIGLSPKALYLQLYFCSGFFSKTGFGMRYAEITFIGVLTDAAGYILGNHLQALRIH